MKTFVKVFLFFSGLVVSLAGALAIFYKLFKKHCVIHIEFNPAEENTHEFNCEDDACEICNPKEEDKEDAQDDEIEFELVDDENK